jgi:hypothetical protein
MFIKGLLGQVMQVEKFSPLQDMCKYSNTCDFLYTDRIRQKQQPGWKFTLGDGLRQGAGWAP